MGARYKVVLRGFSDFERDALGAYFRLSAERHPAYELVATLALADFAVADADQPAIVDEITQAGRLHDTVFVGSTAPRGAGAWTMRPIDALQVQRELDALAAHRADDDLPTVPSALMPWRATPSDADGVDRPQRRAHDSQPGDLDDAPAFEPLPLALPPRRRADALLVDDSDVALRHLEHHLHALGLTTQRARGAARALEWLAHDSYDFVFVDIDLDDAAGLDALALCRHIKRAHRGAGGHAPVVVMLSAHASGSDRVRATLAGADACLTKPLDAALLHDTLQRHGARVAPATGSRRRR
ncbi:response regulator [Azohydromonas sediminis]|uniref:response regulator n=1 Tax=Azohydromonas sediminis TaxID=2259674 RepID=UPI0013C2E6FD|nr:response regulator [Azohydromonas sediminis]